MQFLAVVSRQSAGDITVFAINAAHAVQLRTGRTPHGCGGPLLRRLLVVLRIDDRSARFAENLIRVDLRPRHVPDQISYDSTRMHGESADALMLTDRVEPDGKQSVRRLR